MKTVNYLITTTAANLRVVVVLCLLLGGFGVHAQQLTPEQRKEFVVAQDAYLKDLRLSVDQRRLYEEITRVYEKKVMAARGSKPQIKSIKKEKDSEMKKILSPGQFKKYLKRQKEIDEILGE